MKPELTLSTLWQEAAKFADVESAYDEPCLYGVTDGKAVGTLPGAKVYRFFSCFIRVSAWQLCVRH